LNSKACITPGCSRSVIARNMCSACYQRWYRKKHLAEACAYSRKYYELHSEKIREQSRKLREQNLERYRGYDRKSYKLHSEEIRERSRKDRKQNPAKYQRYYDRRRKAHPGRAYLYSQKWRKQNPDLRNAQRRRNYQRGARHAINGGQSYDDFDNQMILDKTIVDDPGGILKEDVSDRELARFLGRTVAAIQVQRHKLKNYEA